MLKILCRSAATAALAVAGSAALGATPASAVVYEGSADWRDYPDVSGLGYANAQFDPVGLGTGAPLVGTDAFPMTYGIMAEVNDSFCTKGTACTDIVGNLLPDRLNQPTQVNTYTMTDHSVSATLSGHAYDPCAFGHGYDYDERPYQATVNFTVDTPWQVASPNAPFHAPCPDSVGLLRSTENFGPGTSTFQWDPQSPKPGDYTSTGSTYTDACFATGTG
jgi:hypothetical protein